MTGSETVDGYPDSTLSGTEQQTITSKCSFLGLRGWMPDSINDPQAGSSLSSPLPAKSRAANATTIQSPLRAKAANAVS